MGASETLPAIVVGAGPAGLATSYELMRRGIEHRVLERGDRAGYTWAHLYDSLVLHTAKRMSVLPGMRFPKAAPLFPARSDFAAYLERYVTTFRLPVRVGVNVTRAERQGSDWTIETAAGEVQRTRSLVIATGIVSNPVVPEFPNRHTFLGRVDHSACYRRPDAYRGQRVLVVGVGNSGGEIASELARAGVKVTIAVRSGAIVVPRDILGVPLQYLTPLFGWFPRRAQRATANVIGRVAGIFKSKPVLPPPGPGPCVRVPLIGFHLVNAIRAGTVRLRGGIDEFTRDGVRFLDGSTEVFDAVILATGYRAAVGMLGSQIGVDDCGFGRRRDRVVSTDQPDLYFVGHNPDIRGGIYTMGRDARRAANLILASQKSKVGSQK